MSKTIKQRKKRRTREPFIVISEWKGKRKEETRWDFTKEDIQKSIDKMVKDYDYFYNDNRSPYKGNKDYDPCNYRLVDILPYPKKWYRDWETDRKSTRLNSSHSAKSRMPSSA